MSARQQRQSPRERAQAFLRFALGIDEAGDNDQLRERFAEWAVGQARRGVAVRPLERQAVAVAVRGLLGSDAADAGLAEIQVGERGDPRVTSGLGTYRYRRVIVSGKLLEQLLVTGYSLPARILEGLPAGARFVSGGYAQQGSEGGPDLVLTFEHESFEAWHPGTGPAPVQAIVTSPVNGPLRVVPGDMLVVRYEGALPPEEISGMRGNLEGVLERHFGFKVRALIVDRGGEVAGVLRATS